MPYQDNLNRINDLDNGIHNPARLMIIFLLARNRRMDYTDLMKETNMTSGNITTHLNKLQDNGFIAIHKSFLGRKPHTEIELTPAGLAAYQAWGQSILWALPEEHSALLALSSDVQLGAERSNPNVQYYDHQSVAQEFPPGRLILPASENDRPVEHRFGQKPQYHPVTVEPVPEYHQIPPRLNPGFQPLQVCAVSLPQTDSASRERWELAPPVEHVFKLMPEYELRGQGLPPLNVCMF